MRSSAKLRNLFLILRPPKLGSGALQLKLTHRAVIAIKLKVKVTLFPKVKEDLLRKDDFLVIFLIQN